MRVRAAAGDGFRPAGGGDVRRGLRRVLPPVQLACGPVGRGALRDALAGRNLPARDEVSDVDGGAARER